MDSFGKDNDFGRKFIPEIKVHLARVLVTEAPLEEDMKRNTDLVVLRLDTTRVACRIRRHHHLEKYGGQFTIRESRPSGCDTELSKLISGWGDYFFYGFSAADPHRPRLERWILGDLKVFRLWFQRQLFKRKGNMPGVSCKNNDGSSDFRAFEVSLMPEEFFVARFGFTEPPKDNSASLIQSKKKLCIHCQGEGCLWCQ